MKELWFLVAVLLMLGVLAGFSNLTSPTSSFAANLPPQWDFPTTEFTIPGRLHVNLLDVFFDPDGDILSFSVSPGEGISAGIYNDALVVYAEHDGELTIIASDGKAVVSQKIKVYVE